MKVGDRVKGRYTSRQGTVRLIAPPSDSDRYITLWDNGQIGNDDEASLKLLTRISPAMPQAKFSVGQRVRIKERPTVTNTIARTFIGYAMPNGLHYEEAELEAVPVPCPTCGGKVG